MNKIKNSMIIASYVLLIAVFFMGGYALGGYNKDVTGVVQATVSPGYGEAVNAVNIEEAEEMTVYTVIMENGILKLYSVTGGVSTLLGSEEISENIFPREDIELLKNGVTMDNIGDAQALFENFVS